ncbi:MAG TPA: ferrous iron transport protein A [Firmicutes bacterium]|nr:ferrous iron transport protein A [Bacillota bacterium]
MKPLSDLPAGSLAAVCAVGGGTHLSRRLLDYGIVEGTDIQVLQKSLCGDPTAYLVRGTVVAIRRDDAKEIMVE